MKRKISLGLILVLMLSFLTACGGSTTSDLEDGTYTAESDYDEHGFRGEIEIEIKDGKIESVNYDEVNEDGDKKSEDSEYGEEMEAVSGITPKDAYEQLEEALIKSGNPDDLDAVSGATTSAEMFIELAKEALK